ncbi:MAG TPA: YbhN family protein [Solirubrobacteraceae bacterium]|nr:YbhN family protein [Solirubrobacteraceae bacterium]
MLTATAAVALYVGLPQIAGLHDTWGRLSSGDPVWLVAAALFEACSYAAYVLTFHRIFAYRCARIGWRESYDISLAGVAASRLLALAGAGGIALSAWALRRSGMGRRALLSGLTTFYAALYAVFMAALVLAGSGLHTGLLGGPAPFGLTVVPALFGALVIVGALVIAALSRPADLATGVRGAIALLRERDIALLGAVCWWAFDIAVLAACFHAFGPAPPAGVVVMAYFCGMLANVLPFPGGLGGVEGGMIGAFLAFGVDGGLAVAVVLSYRAFAYWLPMIPGALSYVRLLRTMGNPQPAP